MSASEARQHLAAAEAATTDWRELVAAKAMLEDADAPRAPEPPVIHEDGATAAAFEALVAGRNRSGPQVPRAAHPEMAEDAFHGLAGRITRKLEPHSEADPAAILVSTLSVFGAMCGAGPHALADGAQHPARINALIVGDTSKSRKGTAWARARQVPAMVDHTFMNERIVSGFGSGEALVDACAPHPGEDEAPVDKRLLVVESEFARILAVSKREGSTLSSLLRQGWDGDRLQVRSRAGTAIASGAHLVVLGHITKAELLARVAESDVYGGLLNRFLIVSAHRSKLLPGGGNLDESELAELARSFRNALDLSRRVGIMHRTPEAEAYWAELYVRLAGDDPGGLLGAVIARDTAHVLRLSVTYALMDGCRQIDLEHVLAAEAVWDYCRASAAAIFGNLTGDAIADRILAELESAGSKGLSVTEVNRIFGSNISGERLAQARQLLMRRGLVDEHSVPTAGRPRVVLRCADPSYLLRNAQTAAQAGQNDSDGYVNNVKRALLGETGKRVAPTVAPSVSYVISKKVEDDSVPCYVRNVINEISPTDGEFDFLDTELARFFGRHNDRECDHDDAELEYFYTEHSRQGLSDGEFDFPDHELDRFFAEVAERSP
jgi:hypothetical protein